MPACDEATADDHHRHEAAAVRPLLRQADYFGAVPRAELSKLMGRAAVLVMPIGWPEPFGLVAAEAQMAGCPVVAYRRGALVDVVEDGVSGVLVEPGDRSALPAAIRRAITLDRRGVRESAGSRLGVNRMIAAYHDALTQVAEGFEPPTADSQQGSRRRLRGGSGAQPGVNRTAMVAARSRSFCVSDPALTS